MRITVVRYAVAAGRGPENAALVAAVYAELRELEPPGFRYVTLRLADGVAFIHIAIDEEEVTPLPGLASFRRFQRGIDERCVEGPTVTGAEIVGSFGFGDWAD